MFTYAYQNTRRIYTIWTNWWLNQQLLVIINTKEGILHLFHLYACIIKPIFLKATYAKFDSRANFHTLLIKHETLEMLMQLSMQYFKAPSNS